MSERTHIFYYKMPPSILKLKCVSYVSHILAKYSKYNMSDFEELLQVTKRSH